MDGIEAKTHCHGIHTLGPGPEWISHCIDTGQN